MSRPFESTVAGLTNPGPREENQDRHYAALSEDGSWVVTVADGLGGHARGVEAAEVAVTGFPDRIESPADLKASFAGAHGRVAALAHGRVMWRELARIPMATLCVAAWTPTGGLLVGQTGDTIAAVVSRAPGGDAEAAFISEPQRGLGCSIVACLGLPGMDLCRDGRWHGFSIAADSEHTIIVASDGAWEPLARRPPPRELELDHRTFADSFMRLVAPAAAADQTARAVHGAAANAGLDDNATLAVAHMRPLGGG